MYTITFRKYLSMVLIVALVLSSLVTGVSGTAKANMEAGGEENETSDGISVEMIVEVPDNTPLSFNTDGERLDDTIYMAGNFNDWNPMHPDYVLIREEDSNVFKGTFHFQEGQQLEYKFTRGAWDYHEHDADGNNTDNRQITVVDEGNGQMSQEEIVERWSDHDVLNQSVYVHFNVTAPENTPSTDSIILAGNFEGEGEPGHWNPGNEDYALHLIEETDYTKTVTLDENYHLQYKYTRGSWETVEQDGDGYDIPNRELTTGELGTQVIVTEIINRWRDHDELEDRKGEDDEGDEPNIHWDELKHDSYDPLFRSPFGAVPTGEDVTIRFQTKANDVEEVVFSYYDQLKGQRHSVDMEQVGVSPDLTHDYWEVTLNFEEHTIIWYHFVARNRGVVAYYGDNDGRGGIGEATDNNPNDYQLTVFKSKYKTPDWMKIGITYQIFPDRFHDGDPTNNQTEITEWRQGRGHVPIVEKQSWYQLPDYTRAVDGLDREDWPDWYTDPDSWYHGDGNWHNDFFGGDLRGLIDRLDYLQDLGIKIIYLNPIFEATSTHKYDTADYSVIDSMFGTNSDFEELAEEVRQRGMNLILDGVFNHVGDDSKYFDRYGKFYHNYYESEEEANQNIGAHYALQMQLKAENPDKLWDIMQGWWVAGHESDHYDLETHFNNIPEWDDTIHYSPYASWFAINRDTLTYDGWWGFDSLPEMEAPGGSELNNEEFADYILRNDDSITRRWVEMGSSGWRLDVAPEVSHDFWQAFRSYLVGEDRGDLEWPNGQPIILTENWGDATYDLLGDAFDSTMNYRFRGALFHYILSDSQNVAAETDQMLMDIYEDYPKEAFYAMMNLMGSHDTIRMMKQYGDVEPEVPWTPEADRNLSEEEIAERNQLAYDRVKLTAILQLTYPGSPTIYYGDEIGVTGFDDPDDRRSFPWAWIGMEEREQYAHIEERQSAYDLHEHHRTLAQIRNNNLVFATGDLTTLHAEGDVYAFGRKITGGVDALGNTEYVVNYATNETIAVEDSAAIVVTSKLGANNVQVDVSSFIRDGVEFVDQLNGGETYVVENGTLTISLDEMWGAVLVAADGQDLTPPQQVTGLQADGHSDNISLSWNAVDDAVSYNVYRTTVQGGYHELVGTTTETEIVDSTIEKGIKYHYTVTAVDAAGNESERSGYVTAFAIVDIGWTGNMEDNAHADGHVIGVQNTVRIASEIWIDGETNSEEELSYLRSRVGLKGPNDTDFKYTRAQFIEGAYGGYGSNHLYGVTITPDWLGEWEYVMEYSTDLGQSWTRATLTNSGETVGSFTVIESDDTTPPPAPTLEEPPVESNRVELTWSPVDADDLVYYEVYRDGQMIERLDVTSGTTFVDTRVTNDVTYTYKIAAVDISFNRGFSNEVVVTPERVLVDVEFIVHAPDYTPREHLIHMPGGHNNWDPSDPDYRLSWNDDIGAYTGTFTFQEGSQFEYKFARSSWEARGSWEFVEKGAYGEEIDNRSLRVVNEGGNKMSVELTVERWRDIPLHIYTPTNGYETESPTLTLEGDSYHGGIVTVGEQELELTENGRFIVENIPLEIGENEIAVSVKPGPVARDNGIGSGDEAEVTRTIRLTIVRLADQGDNDDDEDEQGPQKPRHPHEYRLYDSNDIAELIESGDSHSVELPLQLSRGKDYIRLSRDALNLLYYENMNLEIADQVYSITFNQERIAELAAEAHNQQAAYVDIRIHIPQSNGNGKVPPDRHRINIEVSFVK